MIYTIPKGAKILAINDEYVMTKNTYTSLEGLHITTSNGDIKLLIGNSTDCCERWDGAFLETPDDPLKYIGAKILQIEDTNDRELNPDDGESRETQLKIITNRGVLQYAVYNSHNGYYSHATFLQVFAFVENSSL